MSAQDSSPPSDKDEPGNDRQHSEEAEERSAPGGHIVYAAIQKEGESELERSNSALAWSGLAAGLSMGFSMVAEGLLTHHLPDTEWRPLVAKLGYGVGFLIVVLGRQQLFTENTLTVILPLLQRRDLSTLLNVLRLWGVVLAANLVGTCAFAWVAGHTSVFEPELRAEFVKLGERALAPAFGTTMLRGVFAGWLIALMVWLMPFAETARLWVILIITYVIALGSFSHIIVGSVEVQYLVVTGVRSFWEYAGTFLFPAFVGNVIGGVSLVAVLAHAQFVATEQKGGDQSA